MTLLKKEPLEPEIKLEKITKFDSFEDETNLGLKMTEVPKIVSVLRHIAL